LQHRERHGDQRHDREQRRVHEAHRVQAELAAGEVAQQRVQVAQGREQPAQRPAADGLRQVEQPVLELAAQRGQEFGCLASRAARLARPPMPGKC
jgi:hypothetical protein